MSEQNNQADIVNSFVMSSDHWVYGFAQIDIGVIEHKELTIYEKMTYIVIKRMVNQNNHITFPSYNKIAEKVGCSRRKAVDSVTRLIELDLIQLAGRHPEYGSNIYMIKRIQESKVLAEPDENMKVFNKVMGIESGSPAKPSGDQKEKKKADPIPYKKIITHLNQKCDSKYGHTGQANQKLIKARWNEMKKAGLNEDQMVHEFMKVIDVKVAQWKESDTMKKYLRPSTLFGNKFDQYRNESEDQQPPKMDGGDQQGERFAGFLNEE